MIISNINKIYIIIIYVKLIEVYLIQISKNYIHSCSKKFLSRTIALNYSTKSRTYAILLEYLIE